MVRFGRGRHYLIDRIEIWDGPNKNDVSHIAFTRCRGLRIDLNGSTIHVKGDYHRGGDAREGRFSWSSAVIPFVFNRCSDLVVENGTLNGNADKMTKDRAVEERSGNGIALNGCTQVLLEGLHIHHFSTDGVRIGLIGRQVLEPCRDIRINQSRMIANGRQALTNAGGVRVIATDCEFSETGHTGGPYRHPPGAGVDIEPNRKIPQRSDFKAVRCQFNDNRGGPLIAVDPHRVSFVELIDCTGKSAKPTRMNLRGERCVVRGGKWHNIQIACAYAAHRPFKTGIAIDVSRGTWGGDHPGWSPVHDVNAPQPNVRIHQNRFELRSPRPFDSSYLFRCANPNHQFENNQIFVSRGGHDGAGEDLIGGFQRARLVRGNRWVTDVARPLHFANDYTGARSVEGEVFSGSFRRKA